MKKTLLVVGDLTINGVKKAPNITSFLKEADGILRSSRVNVRMITYEDLFTGESPEIRGSPITAILFFPFQYWNKHIEIYGTDGRIYGDEHFGREFRKLFTNVKRALRKKYALKNLRFINPPASCFLDRDKKRTRNLLCSKGIPMPRVFSVHSLSQAYTLVNKGIALYIKPRFGAMGKGMTYLSAAGCFTNYLFKKGRVVSRRYDYNWNFTRVRKQDAFLRKLLEKDMVWEEAIRTPSVKGRRFDLRIYVVFDKVPYLYAKTAPKSRFVTNWSQGGKIEPGSFLEKRIPKKKLREAITLARKTARVMGMKFSGVDVIFSEDFSKTYVLEAHSFPAYEKGYNLMKCLLERIRWKRS